MSIAFKILGSAGGDNALFVRVDSGQAIDRLLLDCGEDCLSALPPGEIQEIDGLFFSHLHMDHVAGFDAFFRRNYDRETKPNRIWGPQETARIMQHRFQGYMWNLHRQSKGAWRVTDLHRAHMESSRFELHEAFSIHHRDESRAYEKVIWKGAAGVVEALMLDHGTPSMGYIVREHPRQNVDVAKMASLGLRPGPWVKRLKDRLAGPDTIVIDGAAFPVEELRQQLVTETPGDSIAYLTDFQVDERGMEALGERLCGCRTLICEAQYRHAELELATKHRHMTAALTAILARRAQVEELVLIHVSTRYSRSEWEEMLREARGVFPNTRYPEHWGMA